AAIYGVPLVFLIVIITSYFRVRVLNEHQEEEINRALSILLAEIYVYLVIAALWYLACVACLIHSLRIARDGTERQQVKVILIGSLAAMIPIGSTLYLAALERNAFGAGAATWPMFAASAC